MGEMSPFCGAGPWGGWLSGAGPRAPAPIVPHLGEQVLAEFDRLAERAASPQGDGGRRRERLRGPDRGGQAERAWAEPALRPWSDRPGHRVAVPVWRDPWMVVGVRTFTGDVLTRLGLVNAFGAGPGRYPRVEVGEIRAAAPEVVLLPDEQPGPGDRPWSVSGWRGLRWRQRATARSV